jgi:hypothetical protein
MPATLTAVSNSTSQLFFDFETGSSFAGNSGLEVCSLPEVYAEPGGAAVSYPTRHRNARPRNATLRNEAVRGRASMPPSAQAGQLSSRGAGEVRIGKVMLQLLKRYGITDQEIEEGLAEYALQVSQTR